MYSAYLLYVLQHGDKRMVSCMRYNGSLLPLCYYSSLIQIGACMKINNYRALQYLRLLIYGQYGSGKTTFCATAGLDPRTSPVFWINSGGNPQVIAAKRLHGAKIHVFDLEEISEFEDIYNWFANGQKLESRFAQKYGLKRKYPCIVFDGYTGIQKKSFQAVQGKENFIPGRMPPKPSWDQFGKVLGQMVTIGSMFYELPDMHIIATALEHTDHRQIDPNDKESTIQYKEPALQGQTLEQLPGWALNVGRMAVTASLPISTRMKVKGKPFTILQFERTETEDAKDQHGLGFYHGDPTISQMLDILGWERQSNGNTKEESTTP